MLGIAGLSIAIVLYIHRCQTVQLRTVVAYTLEPSAQVIAAALIASA